MRPATRLLAAVKPVSEARYLHPGDPTGLTGLHAHASPRATLLFLYRATLAKLAPLPATSVYRQSVEAVTKQRLAAVEAVKPEGFDAWAARASAALARKKQDAAELETGDRLGGGDGSGGMKPFKVAEGAVAYSFQRGEAAFVVMADQPEIDERDNEWDGEGEPETIRYNNRVRAVEQAHAVRIAVDKVNARFGKKAVPVDDHHGEITQESYFADLKKAAVDAKDREARKAYFLEVLKEEEEKRRAMKADVWEKDPQLTIDQ